MFCSLQITFEHPDVEISCHPSNVAYLTSKHDDRYSQAFRFELKYNPDTVRYHHDVLKLIVL